MLMKVHPELEPMQRLREAVPIEFHHVLSLLTGTVAPPADQPACATAVLTMVDCLLEYTRDVPCIVADFLATLHAAEEIRAVLRVKATQIEGHPIAAQMTGRLGRFPTWALLTSLPIEAKPLRVALGAEIAHAILTQSTLHAGYCNQLRAGVRQYGRPASSEDRLLEDLEQQGFGRKWGGHFLRIDRKVRSIIQEPDPRAPSRPAHADVRHPLEILARLRWRCDYPDPKHRQAALDDSHLPPKQFLRAAAAVRQRVQDGDAAAIVQSICLLTRLPPDLALSLPLRSGLCFGQPVGIDVGASSLMLDLRYLFPGRATATGGIAHLFEQAGELLRVPLPLFLGHALEQAAALSPWAQVLGDLVDWPLLSSYESIVDEETCKLRSSLARASKSTPAIAVAAGASRLVAACLTCDFSVIGSARMYYARLTGEEIHEGASRLYSYMGWEEPAIATAAIPAVGSHCVLTAHGVHEIFAQSAAECARLRPGPRAGVDQLLAYHVAYTRYAARLVSFCLGLRGARVYRLLAQELRDGQRVVVLHDKAGGDPFMAQAVVLNAVAAEQVRQYLAHCEGLLVRLDARAAAADRFISIRRALQAVLTQSGPLFVTVGVAGRPRPAGAQSVWQHADGATRLPANCGRHYWQNALREQGLSSADIDRFMRHRVVGFESNTTSQVMPPLASFARIAAAQERRLANVGVAALTGIRRAK